MNLPGQVVHIADFLSHGPENGVTLRHLEKLTSLDNRTIRRQIERERRAGALIISDNQHGYFLTDAPEDLGQLLEREVLAIRWQPCFEYWADTLADGTPEEQAQIYRERGQIARWIEKVLSS